MLGPVFHLELVTSARRGRHFWWRVLYTGLLLTVMVLVYLFSFGLEQTRTIAAAGEYAWHYLQAFSMVQLAAVLLLGPAMAAGAIARERERRTIEYLFTTHLNSGEIVLHKLAAAIAQLAFGVLAGVPVLAIAMLLGGITPEAVLGVTVVTLSTIVAVTSISLAASTISPRSREAVAAAYGVLFLALVGPAILQGLTRGTMLASVTGDVSEALASVNPWSVMSHLFSTEGSGGPAAERWVAVRFMVVCHLSLSAVLVLFSAWGLRRFSLSFGGGSTSDRGQRWFRPSLGDRPLIWKEMFANRSYSRLARLGRAGLWLLVGLAVLGTLWQFFDCWISGRFGQFTGFALWLGTILECLGLLLAAAWASNSVASEREKETWQVLVSTPLEAREILFGKLAGSLYAARLTLVPVALIWALAAAAEPRLIPAISLTLSALLAAALASSMLGLFFSFWCQNSTRALGATLASALAAVTLGTCCIFPLGLLNPLFILVLPCAATMIWLQAPQVMTTPLVVAGVVYGALWAAGVAVHLGGAWLLWAICANRFEHYAGRTDALAQSYPPSGGDPFAPQNPS